MSETVEIQVQDVSGSWSVMATTLNEAALIYVRMSEIKERYPDMRVRAVDSNGRIIDILP